MQAQRVPRERTDRAGLREVVDAELRAEVAAVGRFRLTKREGPFTRGRQAVALVGGEEATLAFALAEPSAEGLGIIPLDVDGGMVVGVLKPGRLSAVG